MSENHYNVLEVPENASSDEIKKAYRKLSLKYHPDKNPGKPEVVETFHKINNSYEILGSVDKKSEYDMMRKNPFAGMMPRGGGGGGGNPMEDMLANMFFGGMPGGGMPGGFGGMPGGMPNGMPGNIFMHGMPGMHNIGGGGGGGFPPGFQIFRNGVPVNMNQIQKPTPIIKTLPINMEMVLNGGSAPMEVERWILENGNKHVEFQTIYVSIAKGVDNNEIIMLENQGNVMSENCKGDIKVFIKIENDTEFQRRGLDLILDKKISLRESLCGFSFELKYINGKDYTINNQTGSIIAHEYHKIIPGMGLTRDDHIGNLIIIFHVEFPKSLTLEQINALNKILV